jgi:hypothetical protein
MISPKKERPKGSSNSKYKIPNLETARLYFED